MPRQALDTSKSLARLLQQRRRELGLTLREVETLATREGQELPFSTLSKIEKGIVDPGIKRLHLLMKLYDLPFQVAQDVLDLEEIAGDLPDTRDPNDLFERGRRLFFDESDPRRGLAYLLKVRELPRDGTDRALRQKGLLTLAIAVGNLGKFNLSLQIIKELLLDGVEPELMVNVLVQAGYAWSSIGSAESSLAYYQRAKTHLRSDEPQKLAWILQGESIAYRALGDFDRAESSIREAIKEFRSAGDSYGENKAAAPLINLHLAAGRPARALELAAEAEQRAETLGNERLVVLRKLDQGRALVQLDRGERACSVLGEVLAWAIGRSDSALQFYAHATLWKAHRSLGNAERADLELKAASYFVRFVDEVTPEVNEVREQTR